MLLKKIREYEKAEEKVRRLEQQLKEAKTELAR